MTWVIKVIYQHSDRSKPLVGIQQELADEVVERSGFGIREAYFKQMLATLDKELKDENT